MRVVLLNQYYVPDVASTGHLVHELAAELAIQGWDVSVITSRPSYGPRESWQPAPRKEFHDGVRVHRMWTTRFSKDNLRGRACNLEAMQRGKDKLPVFYFTELMGVAMGLSDTKKWFKKHLKNPSKVLAAHGL